MLRAEFKDGKATIHLTDRQKKTVADYTELLIDISGISGLAQLAAAAIQATTEVMDAVTPKAESDAK